MDPIEERITSSFRLQGLRPIVGARMFSVDHGEVHIDWPFLRAAPNGTATFTQPPSPPLWTVQALTLL